MSLTSPSSASGLRASERVIETLDRMSEVPPVWLGGTDWAGPAYVNADRHIELKCLRKSAMSGLNEQTGLLVCTFTRDAGAHGRRRC